MKRVARDGAKGAKGGIIKETTDLFQEALKARPFLYFELAYTRTTDWMCWLIDRAGGGKNVIATGQQLTAAGACLKVRNALRKIVSSSQPSQPSPLRGTQSGEVQS